MAAHRILITGAGGFVGTWVQRELASRGEDIRVFPAGFGGTEPLALDVRDFEAMSTLVADTKPTAVIHLAGVAAPTEAHRDPRRAWDVNATGTFNLAQATLAHAPEARFLFVGSAEAYGQSFLDAAGAPIEETAALRPASLYGATKAAADMLVGQLALTGLRAVRFRPFNHAGPGQADAFVVSAFARQLAAIEAGAQAPVIEVGNLSAGRDFLDVRDVVRAYADAALGKGDIPDGQALNVATARPVTIQSLLDELIALSGLSVEVRTDPSRYRGNDVTVTSGSTDRISSLLGWFPSIPLSRTLRDTLDYWRKAPA